MARGQDLSPRVLIVASDRELRARLGEEISGAATALFAGSGPAAIAMLTEFPEIAAVVTTLDLAEGPGGFEVLLAARVQSPKSVRCLVTTDDHAFVAVSSDVVQMVFASPWLPGVVGRYLAGRMAGAT